MSEIWKIVLEVFGDLFVDLLSREDIVADADPILVDMPGNELDLSRFDRLFSTDEDPLRASDQIA